MGIEGSLKPAYERLRGSELERLSRELFFHGLREGNQKDIITFHQRNLFGLRGRATINRGGVNFEGIFVCYRIPLEEQGILLNPPEANKFEEWETDSKIMLSLKSPVNRRQEKEATEWLKEIRKRDSRRFFKDSEIEDVRFLPKKYFLAGIRAIVLNPDILDQTWFWFPNKIEVVNDVVLKKTNLDRDLILLAMKNFFNKRFELPFRRIYAQ